MFVQTQSSSSIGEKKSTPICDHKSVIGACDAIGLLDSACQQDRRDVRLTLKV
jgi:hypothetical protein